MEDRHREIFFEIHRDIPREGPGCFECTKRAFLSPVDLPSNPVILDIGCGPGSQTLDLCTLSAGLIVAIDTHWPYLARLKSKTGERGLSHGIDIVSADMFALPFREGAFDVVWAEGSIFVIGFERGLREWRSLIKSGGYLAATELTWLKSAPPREAADFFNSVYPPMRGVEANVRIIEDSGYRIVDCFVLPESAWWDEYYGPIEQRLQLLSPKYACDEEALAVLQAERDEIDMYRKYSDFYGYVFYVIAPI